MKMNLEPLKKKVNLLPSFRNDQALDPDLNRRLRRPMIWGTAVVMIFVVMMVIWSAVASISSAVVAPGLVKIEASRKLIRHREGGTVKAIPVHEGQLVRAGQPLLILDDIQPRAAYDVYQSQYDTALAQNARYAAEGTGRRTIDFPAELLAKATDPRVAGVIRDQQFLFTTRLQFLESQADILTQRQQQIESQMAGTQAQLDALDENVALTKEELAGYQTLFEKGYAPKTLILRYQRTLSDLAGRRGALLSELNRLGEQKGESRLQLASLRDQRISQAAEGMRQMQTTLSDVSPRLTAARQTLNGTVVRSPANGYVLDLAQHTVGGVVGPGEAIMEVVPSDAPLIVSVQIKPQDIDDVRPGMKARVRLTAFNYRKVSPVEADVVNVSADQLTDPKTGNSFFRADLRIPPSELVKMPKGAILRAGMPAQAMIVTGKRTIMSYVISPLTDTIGQALRED